MHLNKSPAFMQLSIKYQNIIELYFNQKSPEFPHCYSTFLTGKRDLDLKVRSLIWNSFITYMYIIYVSIFGSQHCHFNNLTLSTYCLLFLSQHSSVSHCLLWGLQNYLELSVHQVAWLSRWVELTNVGPFQWFIWIFFKCITDFCKFQMCLWRHWREALTASSTQHHIVHTFCGCSSS